MIRRRHLCLYEGGVSVRGHPSERRGQREPGLHHPPAVTTGTPTSPCRRGCANACFHPKYLLHLLKRPCKVGIVCSSASCSSSSSSPRAVRRLDALVRQFGCLLKCRLIVPWEHYLIGFTSRRRWVSPVICLLPLPKSALPAPTHTPSHLFPVELRM